MTDNTTVPGAVPAPPLPKWPTVPSASRALLDGVNPDARADTAANGLVKAGFSVDQVRGALKDSSWQPDTRSAAQRQHDDLHGVQDTTETNLYRPAIPATVTGDPQDVAAVANSTAQLAAALQFPPEAGRSFAANIMRAVAEVDSAAEPVEVINRWTRQLTTMFSNAEIDAASSDILAMLGQLARGDELVARLQRTGLIRCPMLFTALKARAAAFKLWKAGRPA